MNNIAALAADAAHFIALVKIGIFAAPQTQRSGQSQPWLEGSSEGCDSGSFPGESAVPPAGADSQWHTQQFAPAASATFIPACDPMTGHPRHANPLAGYSGRARIARASKMEPKNRTRKLYDEIAVTPTANS